MSSVNMEVLGLNDLLSYALNKNTFENEKCCCLNWTLEQDAQSMTILGKSTIMGTLDKGEFICVQKR